MEDGPGTSVREGAGRAWRRPWSQRPIVLAVATVGVGVLGVYYMVHDAVPRNNYSAPPSPSCTEMGGRYVVTAKFYGTEANADMRRAVAALREDDRVAEIVRTQPWQEPRAQSKGDRVEDPAQEYPSAVVELLPGEDVNVVVLTGDLTVELSGGPFVDWHCDVPK